MQKRRPTARRGTILLMIVGLLAMLFMVVTAYITLARFDRQALAQTASGAKVEQIIRSILDVLVGQIGDSWSDSDGTLKVGGKAYQPIPGSEGAPWLASNEPLRRGADPSDPGAYEYPALTAVGGTATNKGLNDIAFDHPGLEDESPEEVRLARPQSRDRIYNARRSFMDAAGTGIADSWFGDGTNPDSNAPRGVSLLTELANAMDGRTVRAWGFNPARLRPGSGTDWLSFVAFDESARFLTAARVISHGGMVQIGLPNASVAWNRDFVLGMFRWVRHPGSPDSGNGVPTDELLARAWGERAAIEPQLRSRLGLVVGNRVAVPESLATFEKRWPWTFVPGGSNNARTQRFNLATEWDVFRRAATIDPDEFNDWLGSAGAGPRVGYVARQLLTASNTSDELARIATRLPTEPGQLGVYPGQLKYYLGRIAAAFDGNGNFVSDSRPQAYDGYEVIRDLASYYYEMLKEYNDDSWRPETSEFPGSVQPGRAAVSRREQAYMLAVNTVAFAAPRANDGKIDLVHHTLVAQQPTESDKLFAGYVPQPFFTQALAYNKRIEGSQPGEPPTSKLAVAVELYFPDETGDAPGGDKFTPGPGSAALNLEQFAVSLNNQYPGDPSAFVLLSRAVGNHPRLVGKNFIAFSINGQGGNTAFDFPAPVEGVDGTIDTLLVDTLPEDPAATPPKPRRIEVKLWRLNNAGTPRVLVDRIVVSLESLDEAEDNQREWLVSVQRDTRPQPYLGGAGSNLARWRIVAAGGEDGQLSERSKLRGSLDTPELGLEVLDTARRSLNSAAAWMPDSGMIGGGGLLYVPAIAAVPTVPLYTMNAGAELWNFGSSGAAAHVGVRPRSFPTVGFLHFVPRFSHLIAGGTSHPMTEVVGEQVLRTPGGPQQADFGHMPVFANRQEAASNSDFADSRLGRVPWGLLVYDYFTTLDPRGPDAQWNTADDVDPYRLLGRIDINVAPWHVLAGLPVIGPQSNGDLPLPPSASPAFRSAAAGVLTGFGADNTRRFMSDNPNDLRLIPPNVALGQGWWRLGPYLAQAAAAYRDRVQYTSNAPDPLPRAWGRNSDGGYRRTDVYGSIRAQRGFVSIGELANVMGFDGSSDAQLRGGPDLTVLGGYGSDVGGDFMKAVSLLALLDTQHLTTRSNTFTVYTTLAVNDPDDPQASVRAQVTIDRSNLVPRLVMDGADGLGFPVNPRLEPVDDDGDGTADRYAPVIIRSTGGPETIGRREIAYFNARYDE